MRCMLVLTGVTPLPQHQPYKESPCDGTSTQRDNWCDARLESPDFRRRCLIVSTCEGTGRGRLRGTGVAVGGPIGR